MKPTNSILDNAAVCFRSARSSLMEGAKFLHEIAKDELWRGSYSSFAEYLELECQISQGFASKLIKVYQSYVVEGGLSLRKLEGVDYERLYMAIPLKMPADDRVEQAMQLSRSDLRESLRSEKHGDCTHPKGQQEVFYRCKVCGKFHKAA